MAADDNSRSAGRQLSFPVMNSSTCDQEVGEWKEYISQVGKTLTSLANDLDMVHSIVHNDSIDHSLEDEHGKKQLNELQSVRKLLMCLQRTVLHDGHFAIRTVTNFIHTVIRALAQSSGTSVDEYGSLFLDAQKEYNESDSCQILQARKLEMLIHENTDLNEEKMRLQGTISVVTAKERELITENDNLRMKTKVLEECKEQLQMDNKKSKERVTELQNDVKKLRQDYKESGLRKLKIEVLEKENKEITINYDKLQKEHNKRLTRQTKEKDDEYKTKIADLTNEVDLLTNSAKTRDEKLTAAAASVEKANRTIEQLQEKVKERNTLIDLYKTETQRHEKAMQNYETEMSKLSAKYNDIESKSVLEKETSQKKNEENAKIIRELNLKIEDYQRKLEYNEQMQQKYHDLKESHDDTLRTTNLEVNTLKTKLKQLAILERQNTEMKDEQNRLKGDIITLRSEKNLLNKDLQDEKTNNRLLLEKNENLCKSVDNLSLEKGYIEERLSETEETVQTLTRETDRCTREVFNLREELEMYKSKQLIRVQLYYHRRGELITTVEEELTRILRSRIERTGKTEIEFVKCAQTSDVKPELPLLLLCISASRIGTDAANTVHGLQLTSRMSLLIFHHKDVHALPNQASYQVLTGGEYKAMNGIFDLAFLSGKGIYSCPLNENSIDKIVTFIKTESLPGSADGLSR